MRRIALFALALALISPLLVSAPAHAQATRTWVSGVGDDANPCSRTAPCKTFAGAISKTAAAGEINCLDPGGFGALTITKSISISCEIGTAGVLVAGTNGIVVAAGATDRVFLKGLDFDGVGSGLSGILFNSGAYLQVENCVVRNFLTNGMTVQPSVNASFVLINSSFYNNGNGSTGSGLGVKPSGGGTSGTISHTTFGRNTTGITADGSAGGIVNLNVLDSLIHGSTLVGANATSASTPAGMTLMRVAVTANGTGLQTVGGGAFMTVGESAMTGNTVGISGTVNSFGTNQVSNNNSGTLTALPAPALK